MKNMFKRSVRMWCMMLLMGSLVACGGEAPENEKKQDNEAEQISEEVRNGENGSETEDIFFDMEANYKLIKVTEYNAKGQNRTLEEYEYDSDGNMIESKISGEYRKYTYDAWGNVQSWIRCNEDGSSQGGKLFEYDTNGNVIKEGKITRDGEEKWTDAWEYDEAGNIVREGSINRDGEVEWKKRYEYFPTENNAWTIQKGYNSNDELVSWMEFTIDDNGELGREIPCDLQGNPNGTLLYEFDEAHNLRKVIYNQNYNDVTEYDENGNKIKFHHSELDGSLATTIEYEYNSNNQLVKKIVLEQSVPGQGLLTESEGVGVYTFEYDEKGNLLRKIGYYLETSEVKGYIEYIYNPLGNLLKEMVYTADGTEAMWREYEYIAVTTE